MRTKERKKRRRGVERKKDGKGAGEIERRRIGERVGVT